MMTSSPPDVLVYLCSKFCVGGLDEICALESMPAFFKWAKRRNCRLPLSNSDVRRWQVRTEESAPTVIRPRQVCLARAIGRCGGCSAASIWTALYSYAGVLVRGPTLVLEPQLPPMST